MRFRKLRIAWSVVWGLAAVLLIALWVRSYWRHDKLNLQYALYADFQSGRGHLSFGCHLDPWKQHLKSKSSPADPRRIWDWKVRSRPASTGENETTVLWWFSSKDEFQVFTSHWCLVLVLATLTTLPWLHKIRWSK